MKNVHQRTWRKITIAAVLGTVFLTSFFSSASFAQDDDGVPITVQVLTPTVAPSPRPASPVTVPVDVPLSEARFPITLSGLEPYSYVEIFANSTPVLIASGFADSQGVFETTVKLPANLPVGDHTISATNTLSNGTKISTIAVAFSVTSSGRIAPAGTSNDNIEAARARGASLGNGTSSEASVSDETVTGSAASLELGPDPFNLGGVFYVGGLVAEAIYPKNAMTPGAMMSFSIRNVSNEHLSADVVFSVHNIFGLKVGQEARYVLRDVAPGETRHVTASVYNIGQWGIYTAHMKLTPPSQVGNNVLTPFELTNSFFAFPGWVTLWVVLVTLLSAGYVLGMRLRKWPSPRVIFAHIQHFFEQFKSKHDEDHDDDDDDDLYDTSKKASALMSSTGAQR
jgi:hypothetical protein